MINLGNCENLGCENVLTIYSLKIPKCQAFRQAHKAKHSDKGPHVLWSWLHGTKGIFMKYIVRIFSKFIGFAIG
ncbi:MAG TPA: hypothetical protein DCZ40_05680 [Lachnospiraceae bacterium]|nr:hypothetical protein [Lachnospiraceae bacterium]